jgi:hypothetical protein
MTEQQHSRAAVRVCAIADAECSRNCGTGPCKRETSTVEQHEAAPADDKLERPARVGGRNYVAGELKQQVVGRAYAEYDRWKSRAPLEGTGNGADERATEDVPTGAIVNGRTLADRLEAYPFESEGGDLRLCSDWVEFRRCFEHLAEWAQFRAPRTEVAGAVEIQAGCVLISEADLESFVHPQYGPGVFCTEDCVNKLAPAPSADAAAAPADERAMCNCGVYCQDQGHGDCRYDARAAASQPAAAAGQEVAQYQYRLVTPDYEGEWHNCSAEKIRTLQEQPTQKSFEIRELYTDVPAKPEVEPQAQAAGMFVKRSMFGPWIEVDKPEPGAVRLYTVPPAQVATRRDLTDEQAASISWAIRAAKECGYTADAEVLRALLEGAKP